MKNKIFIKILTLLLIAVMVLPLLSACSVRKVPAGKLALTSVGSVNGKEVLYEELFYLASNYLPSLKATYGEDTEGLKKALADKVYENIVTNYAILALCEEAGVSVDEKLLKENIQANLDSLVETECGGSRSKYRDMLKETGMTDHYMRETLRVELLYSELPMQYAKNGILPTSEDAVINFAMENLIRTKHIAILVEDGESREENLEKAQEALDAYQKGEYTFHKLIGSKYNEDLSPQTSDDGYYFVKGSTTEEYEAAALNLSANEVSGIVEGTGTSNITGNTVPCFYIIQRLDVERDYVTKNLSDVQEKCADAIIAKKLDEKKAELEFTPDEFGASLDLTSLEYPKDAFDFFVFFVAFGCTVAIGGVALVVIFMIKRRQKRIEKRRAKNALK